MNTKEKKKLRHKYISIIENRIIETQNVKESDSTNYPLKENHLNILNSLLNDVKNLSHKVYYELYTKRIFPSVTYLSIYSYRSTFGLEREYNRMLNSTYYASVIRDVVIDDLLTN